MLIGEEEELPYERPPLSKGYLLGKDPREKIFVHPAEWYQEQRIDLRLGTAVTDLDPAAHRLTLADGSTLDYARLLLTTGAAPRHLPVPGPGWRACTTCAEWRRATSCGRCSGPPAGSR